MKPKTKIMNTKPEITDEEIQGYMNFDGLMQELKSLPKQPTIPTSIKIISLIGGIIIVSVVSYLIGQNNQAERQENKEPKPTIEILPTLDTKKEILPSKKDSTLNTSSESISSAKNSQMKNLVPTTKTQHNSLETKTLKPSADSSHVIVSTGYQQAEPLEGFPHLYEYFSSELKYPEEAVKDSIQGIVTVSFIITKEGKPEKLKIINSLGQVFDTEVVRLIENMPAWKPATLNNSPVPSKISIPLTFRLERIKK